MTYNIISLTTTPTRMPYLEPVLNSLIKQTARIESVILWVPRRYRRSEFTNFTIPRIPSGVDVRRCDVDYGPATKILPAVEDFRGEDVRILYCDDDRVYDCNWASRIIKESDLHPDECICEAGRKVSVIRMRAFASSQRFRVFSALSGGLYARYLRRQIRTLDRGIGLVDIAMGYGGVMVRPNFISASAFDIPDVLWTVDDIWLSGHLTIGGTKIRKIVYKPTSSKSEASSLAALESFIFNGHDRHAANLECIRYFQVKYGIWGGQVRGKNSLASS